MVTRNVATHGIVGGNPAHVVCKWFGDRHNALLHELSSSGWTEAQLQSAMQLRTSGDIEALQEHPLREVC